MLMHLKSLLSFYARKPIFKISREYSSSCFPHFFRCGGFQSDQLSRTEVEDRFSAWTKSSQSLSMDPQILLSVVFGSGHNSSIEWKETWIVMPIPMQDVNIAVRSFRFQNGSQAKQVVWSGLSLSWGGDWHVESHAAGGKIQTRA